MNESLHLYFKLILDLFDALLILGLHFSQDGLIHIDNLVQRIRNPISFFL